MDGAANKSEVNHFINDVNELGADIKRGNDTNGRLAVLPLNKALSESTLDQIKEKYSHLNISYIK